jgi:Flp pilus assembly protein TadD
MAVRQGEIDHALLLLDGATRADPTFASAWSAKGALLEQLRSRPDEALACFDRALELEPTRADVWLGRGNLLRGMGRLVEADVSFGRASALVSRARERLGPG